MQNFVAKWCETGSVVNKNRNYPKSVRTPENIAQMKDEWNREKLSPARVEHEFSALRADDLSTKPHWIPIPIKPLAENIVTAASGFERMSDRARGRRNVGRLGVAARGGCARIWYLPRGEGSKLLRGEGGTDPPEQNRPEVRRSGNIENSRLRWAGHVARMGESRNAYRVLVGRPEGKRILGRPRRRWEDNIKMDLREVGYDDREWLNLAQDRNQWRAYVRAAMNLRVP
ncbi:hypothetical protein ANN_12901 [Periplaneta americana]|uniref:Uncharacterized protein n=1 Tax=Periplaneta americana TaxID=6978 RepID=A0ABQ8TKF0_PERAM|nr:hypothetical protein ANN_12901 [Periplaneta americana]